MGFIWNAVSKPVFCLTGRASADWRLLKFQSSAFSDLVSNAHFVSCD